MGHHLRDETFMKYLSYHEILVCYYRDKCCSVNAVALSMTKKLQFWQSFYQNNGMKHNIFVGDTCLPTQEQNDWRWSTDPQHVTLCVIQQVTWCVIQHVTWYVIQHVIWRLIQHVAWCIIQHVTRQVMQHETQLGRQFVYNTWQDTWYVARHVTQNVAEHGTWHDAFYLTWYKIMLYVPYTSVLKSYRNLANGYIPILKVVNWVGKWFSSW